MSINCLQDAADQVRRGNLAGEILTYLERIARALRDAETMALRGVSLTSTQFTVLGILCASDAAAGLSCTRIAQRMPSRDPDLTRLLDRLEHRGLVTRYRPATNRRVVITQLTEKGRKLVDDCRGQVVVVRGKLLAHLSDEQLAEMTHLLKLTQSRTSRAV